MAALIVAVVLVVRGIAGADQHVANGLATAGWFVLVGAGVIAAGRALMLGKRWGRGLAVITQLLLLPVAWYLAVGSHQPGYGIPAGLVALVVLGLLFSPAAVRWPPAVRVTPPAPPTATPTAGRWSIRSAVPRRSRRRA